MSTYASGTAFRSALEARLSSAAAAGGRPVGRARKLVAFSRLLARLQETASGQWVLKGGFALELRFLEQARATRDIDLDWVLSLEEATEALITGAAYDLDDYFTFQVSRAREEELGAGGGVRFRADAYVGGRLFEQLTIDIGFVTDLPTSQDTLEVPGLLEFAGIAGPRVPATPLELHLAEKLHAYTKSYGGHESSRPKDLIDMVLISDLASFEAGRLRETIRRLFHARATHPVPDALPLPPANWSRSYRLLAEEVGIDVDPRAGHEQAARLLNAVLGTEPQESRWEPASQRWE